jgi:hypothetical protein
VVGVDEVVAVSVVSELVVCELLDDDSVVSVADSLVVSVALGSAASVVSAADVVAAANAAATVGVADTAAVVRGAARDVVRLGTGRGAGSRCGGGAATTATSLVASVVGAAGPPV